MKLRYAPEGVAPREWEFDPLKLMSPECMVLEKLTGMDYATEFTSAVSRGNMSAIHALLYVYLKRSHPTLKADEVQFSLSEIDFIVEDADLEDADEDAPAEDSEPGKG